MRFLGEMEIELFWFSVVCLDGVGVKGLMFAGALFDLYVKLSNVVKR